MVESFLRETEAAEKFRPAARSVESGFDGHPCLVSALPASNKNFVVSQE
jgi:hypothetical protein